MIERKVALIKKASNLERRQTHVPKPTLKILLFPFGAVMISAKQLQGVHQTLKYSVTLLNRKNKLLAYIFLKEMGIPDHITCLLKNMYADQEATVRTGHETKGWV